MGWTRLAAGAVALVLLGAAVNQAALAHGKKHNPTRYDYVMKNGVPESYLDKENPLAASEENLADGARVYAENCAACHGPKGQGDGPDAKDLKPKPPELASMMTMITNMKDKHKGMHHGAMKAAASREMSMMTEGYVYWTISEGGTALESPMPPFKDALSEKEIWQVMLYMANGFDAKPKQ